MIVARSVVGIPLRVLLEKKLHTRFDATDELSQIEIDLPSSPPSRIYGRFANMVTTSRTVTKDPELNQIV